MGMYGIKEKWVKGWIEVELKGKMNKTRESELEPSGAYEFKGIGWYRRNNNNYCWWTFEKE